MDSKVLTELVESIRRMEAALVRSEQRAYSQKDAASLLGVSYRHLKRMVKRMEIRTVSIGGKRQIPASEIQRLTTPAEPLRREPRQRKKVFDARAEADALRAAIRRA